MHSGHTRVIYSHPTWFINLGIEWSLGVGKYNSNTPEKYHPYQSVEATGGVTFKNNFPEIKWAQVTAYTCAPIVRLSSYIGKCGKCWLKRIP